MSEPRPLDYVWNGQRITHYLNHAGEWHGCPATEENHHTLRASVCGVHRFAPGTHEQCGRPFHPRGLCHFVPVGEP